MPTYQAGQPRLATITLTEADASTEASLTVVAPDDTTTLIGATADAGSSFLDWTADDTYVLGEGETIERWTVTGTGATTIDNPVWANAAANATVSGHRVYATSADYAKLIKPTAAPTGLRAKLEAASRIVDEMLLCAVYAVDDTTKMPTDAAVAAAIRDATCFQAQFAGEAGDGQMVGAIKGSGFSLGRLSVQTPGKASGAKGGVGPRGEWSPRAWARLAQEAGLIGSPQDWGSWGPV